MERSARLCRPEGIHICDGTEAENTATLTLLEKQGLIRKLPKYNNWYALSPLTMRWGQLLGLGHFGFTKTKSNLTRPS